MQRSPNMATLPHETHPRRAHFIFGQIGKHRDWDWSCTMPRIGRTKNAVVPCRSSDGAKRTTHLEPSFICALRFSTVSAFIFCVRPGRIGRIFLFSTTVFGLPVASGTAHVMSAATPDPDESDSCRYIIPSDMFCRQLSTFAIQPDAVLLLSPPSSTMTRHKKWSRGLAIELHSIIDIQSVERTHRTSFYLRPLFIAQFLYFVFRSISCVFWPVATMDIRTRRTRTASFSQTCCSKKKKVEMNFELRIRCGYLEIEDENNCSYIVLYEVGLLASLSVCGRGFFSGIHKMNEAQVCLIWRRSYMNMLFMLAYPRVAEECFQNGSKGGVAAAQNSYRSYCLATRWKAKEFSVTKLLVAGTPVKSNRLIHPHFNSTIKIQHNTPLAIYRVARITHVRCHRAISTPRSDDGDRGNRISWAGSPVLVNVRAFIWLIPFASNPV